MTNSKLAEILEILERHFAANLLGLAISVSGATITRHKMFKQNILLPLCDNLLHQFNPPRTPYRLLFPRICKIILARPLTKLSIQKLFLLHRRYFESKWNLWFRHPGANKAHKRGWGGVGWCWNQWNNWPLQNPRMSPIIICFTIQPWERPSFGKTHTPWHFSTRFKWKYLWPRCVWS